MMTMAITVKQLSFSYDKRQVLDHLNFNVPTGSIVGLIGENGAGKTTLLNLLQGQLVSSGQVQIFGRAVDDPNVRKWIGAMPQGDLRLPGVTVQDLLIDLAAYYPDSVRIGQLLSDNGLSALRRRRIDRLSGGQLRRVTFLTSLVGHPKLLFLDEPTVGMDVAARGKLWLQIKQLQQEGVTIVITTHYLEELQDIADQLIILMNGKIQFQGSFAELQDRHEQTIIKFTSSLPETKFREIPGVKSVTYHAGQWNLVSNDGDATLMALGNLMDDIHHVVVSEETLTAIFSNMMQQEDEK
ncbi:ATP-binding cassette domain-containing protein [Secundilactobacillus kimchicus]|uniref:ABC transporter ATP-binding protein n=1 Tax=Secundilactobacillus kimchicus TaxID=528209 RepID=UPI001C01FD8C|nr:ABC transporter ATP-binding protein [Secundilactobacillus kimchicus]MBT9671219.1 ATP-binding cassette domain-containing protein [Secundilactobacillus kimchicus]